MMGVISTGSDAAATGADALEAVGSTTGSTGGEISGNPVVSAASLASWADGTGSGRLAGSTTGSVGGAGFAKVGFAKVGATTTDLAGAALGAGTVGFVVEEGFEATVAGGFMALIAPAFAREGGNEFGPSVVSVAMTSRSLTVPRVIVRRSNCEIGDRTELLKSFMVQRTKNPPDSGARGQFTRPLSHPLSLIGQSTL